MMNEDSRQGYHNKAKQEAGTGSGTGTDTINIDKFSTSRQWPGFRNPRIVRVSRSFGGKDRHSKVCTIRGLRDRRIRLSVQTAVQLYELQERLGVSQPSKVIDWLLEATKYDIEKLPPLQIPQGFPQFHQYQIQTLLPHHHEYSSPSLSLHSNFLEKGKWIKENHEDHGISGGQNQKLLLNNGMGFMNNNNNSSSTNGNSNNPYFNSEPASLSLSQLGSHGCGLLFPSQIHEYPPHQYSSCLPNSSQLLFCPPPLPPSAAAMVPSFFGAHVQNNNINANSSSAADQESDPREQLLLNHVQFLSSSSTSSHHSHSQVAMPPPNISCLHSMNSPLKLPFSSKLLDSDNNNNNPSLPQDHKGSSR